MPYIEKTARLRMAIRGSTPENAGELNYLFTLSYIDVLNEVAPLDDLPQALTSAIDRYIWGKEPKYQLYNDVMGALVSSSAELCRRKVCPNPVIMQRLYDIASVVDFTGGEFYNNIVIPYEDHKIEENGDVYPE